MFYLSQAHLERLKRCPPSFQAMYLDQLVSPTDPEHLQKQQWGTQFHLAMQQLQLGLPLEHITTEVELRQSIEALLQVKPELLDCQQKNAAEYRRTLMIGNFLLTIICDWIVAGEASLQIYDWKTYRQPKKATHLKHHWQTKLYLYVLAETTAYRPEQLSMTYWFTAPGETPTSLTFLYDQAWHQDISQELTLTLHNLQKTLDQYFQSGIPLNHVNHQSCPLCPSSRQRSSPETFDFLEGKSLPEFLGEIEEVQL